MVVALVLAGGLIVFLFAERVLSSDSVRATIEQQLSSRLGQPVTIGSARAGVFPRLALRLGDVTIGDGPHAAFEEISVAMGLRGLFSRRVEEAEAVISGGRVLLPAALALTAAADAPASDEAGQPFTIASVRVISLRNVEIVVNGASVHVDLESALEGDRLDVSRLTARSDGTRLEASGAMTSVSAMVGAFTATADPLDVDELLTIASGATSGSANADGGRPDDRAPPMRVALDIKAPSGRFTGHDFSDLAARLEAMPSRVTVSSLSLGIFGGTFSGALDMDSSGSTPRLKLRGSLAALDVSRLAETAGAPGSISGRLGGAVSLAADGTDSATMLRTAQGTAAAVITDGVIPRLDLVRSIVLAFGKPSGAPPEGSGSAFTRLSGDFTLRNGALRSDNLSMASRDFDLLGRVALTIPGGGLDAAANVVLSKELTAQAGTDLRRYAQEDGRVVVPARITGAIASPRVTVDISAAARRALENELKRKAKGFLEGLFKKKQ